MNISILGKIAVQDVSELVGKLMKTPSSDDDDDDLTNTYVDCCCCATQNIRRIQ